MEKCFLSVNVTELRWFEMICSIASEHVASEVCLLYNYQFNSSVTLKGCELFTQKAQKPSKLSFFTGFLLAAWSLVG